MNAKNTPHPIYKAYKDGELIKNQSMAIDNDYNEDEILWNSKIDNKRCDDLRMLVPSALTSDGEPIYEGDVLYAVYEGGSFETEEVFFNESQLEWWIVNHGPLAYWLKHHDTITHKKPKPERRKSERRELHRRDYDGRRINPNNRYSCEGKSDRRLSETPRRTS